MHVDICEAVFGQVSLQRGKRLGSGHVWDQPQIHLGDGFARQNGLAARTRVTADQPFNIYGGARREQLQRLLPIDIVNPTFDAKKFFGLRLVQTFCRLRDHLLIRSGKRACFRSVALDHWVVAVGRYERGQSLDEMPRRTVHPGFIAGVDVFARPASPFLAAGS